jgi:deferrochelatase/peroxidase EfeB
MARVTRREALSGAALLGLGAGVDHLVGSVSGGSSRAVPDASRKAVSFYGTHQAGIATPAQDYLYFAAFDITSHAVGELQAMLARWTAAAASLTAGAPYRPSGSEPLDEPPVETGEALGLGPSRLTVTFGFGPSLFRSSGTDRFGIARHRPWELQPLPPLQGESLQAGRSGEICACKRVLMTRRLPFTRFTYSRGSPMARRCCAGRRQASGGPRVRAARSRRRAI